MLGTPGCASFATDERVLSWATKRVICVYKSHDHTGDTAATLRVNDVQDGDVKLLRNPARENDRTGPLYAALVKSQPGDPENDLATAWGPTANIAVGGWNPEHSEWGTRYVSQQAVETADRMIDAAQRVIAESRSTKVMIAGGFGVAVAAAGWKETVVAVVVEVDPDPAPTPTPAPAIQQSAAA